MKLTPLTTTDIESQAKNEENTKLKYITPSIQKKWCDDGDKILMEYGKEKCHYFTDGQILVSKDSVKRGERKKVDYLLLVKNNIPLALVEAKGYDHDVNEGIQQALEYAQMLDVPYCYSSNGRQFHEENRIKGTRQVFGMDDFPTSRELWERYRKDKNITENQAKIISSPYFNDKGKKPRYYQRNAINRTIEAIAKGQKRLLIVMATGTGKTYVAKQIIYRLYKTGLKKKILFLVDRDALAKQTFDDFSDIFSKNMLRIGDKLSLKKDEDVVKLSAYEIYISLYHQLKAGKSDEDSDDIDDSEEKEDKNYYKKLPRDFFDLIVVDECHRSSLNEEKGWHKMLEYFDSATLIGLTATPKETEFGSNIDFFCKDNDNKPIYTYTLQQGIKDGFLAPYKIVAVNLDIDENGYKPKEGELDIFGKPLENRLYTIKDFDKRLIIDERRKLVAKEVSDYLKNSGDRFTKTILFCETEEHAAAMMNYLKDENQDLVAEDSKYVMRITNSDKVGKEQIDNFKAPSVKYPVIAVTSKLLSTGVDTQTVGLLVLDKNISSMSEFKQTVGRGTRIKEKYKVDGEEKSKTHFTIIDFRKNYKKFEDKDFDGLVDVDDGAGSVPSLIDNPKPPKDVYHIKGGFIEITDTTVKYLDENMNLVRESNTSSCIEKNIKDNYEDFESFKKAWFESESQQELAEKLFINKKLLDETLNVYQDKDIFDIIAQIGYNKPFPKKEDRIDKAQDYIKSLPEPQQKVLNIALEQYKNVDFNNLKSHKIFDLPIFKQNGYNIKMALKPFGNKDNYFKIITDLERIMFS